MTRGHESLTGYGEPPRRSEPEDFAHCPEKFAEAGAHRVLVVDNDSLIRWAVGESLRAAGYDVVVAADTPSAMRALTVQEEVELVFLDSWLSDAQNLQALEAIRQRWPRLPVVLMTADESTEVRRKALKLGVVTVLKKPFDMADIGSVAKRALRP